MKIYIAGKITGLVNYKKKFEMAERYLVEKGHIVINPAMLPEGLGEHEVYMRICYSMIDAADAIYMLDNYRDSKGALMEKEYAKAHQKIILYQEIVQYQDQEGGGGNGNE